LRILRIAAPTPTPPERRNCLMRFALRARDRARSRNNCNDGAQRHIERLRAGSQGRARTRATAFVRGARAPRIHPDPKESS
jgi:hypothetical protein